LGSINRATTDGTGASEASETSEVHFNFFSHFSFKRFKVSDLRMIFDALFMQNARVKSQNSRLKTQNYAFYECGKGAGIIYCLP
jgi:hypothetical protein